jgi:hypothetical protein
MEIRIPNGFHFSGLSTVQGRTIIPDILSPATEFRWILHLGWKKNTTHNNDIIHHHSILETSQPKIRIQDGTSENISHILTTTKFRGRTENIDHGTQQAQSLALRER